MILSVNEVNALLGQPGSGTPKELRDKAMLELLYATGIRVSELINLKLEDVNMQVGYITCRDRNKERMVPFRKERAPGVGPVHGPGPHGAAQGENLGVAVHQLQRPGHEPPGLLEADQALRGESRDQDRHHPPHTAPFLAAHLIRSGADIHAVQAMLGHSVPPPHPPGGGEPPTRRFPKKGMWG